MAITKPRWTLSCEVGPRAFAPNTRGALEALGYLLVSPQPSRSTSKTGYGTDLRLVDAVGLSTESTPDEILGGAKDRSTAPVILFGRGDARLAADPRIVATVETPASIESLYPALQSALEPTPRQRPRSAAELPAACTGVDQRFVGAVLSLSEGGCLFRSTKAIPVDQPLQLLFPLPGERMVSTRAWVIEQNGGDVALRFENTTTRSRRAIAGYVLNQLVGSQR